MSPLILTLLFSLSAGFPVPEAPESIGSEIQPPNESVVMPTNLMEATEEQQPSMLTPIVMENPPESGDELMKAVAPVAASPDLMAPSSVPTPPEPTNGDVQQAPSASSEVKAEKDPQESDEPISDIKHIVLRTAEDNPQDSFELCKSEVPTPPAPNVNSAESAQT